MAASQLELYSYKWAKVEQWLVDVTGIASRYSNA